MFALTINPNFKRIERNRDAIIAQIYAEPIRVPVALPVPSKQQPVNPVFGKRKLTTR